MTIQAFGEFQRGKPFRPFAVHVADSRMFEVRHPEAAFLSTSGRILWISNVDDELEAVDMLMVVSLRPLVSELRKDKD